MKRFWTILAVLLVVAYIISPIDALPDVFPVIGWLDDAFLVGLLIYYLRYHRLPGFMSRFGELLFKHKPAHGNSSKDHPKGASKDPYDILGVRPGATPEEIHAAYREAAQKYHPDKVAHLGDEFKEMAGRRFVEIQPAYDFLMGKGH